MHSDLFTDLLADHHIAQDMNVEYMLEHGDELYDAVAKDIRDMFDNLASEIEAEIAGKLIQINKLLLSLLGRK